MKFITEEDLRDLYRKEPFTTYELEAGARLTPGARQFLSDKSIHFGEGGFIKKNNENTKEAPEVLERKTKLLKKKLLCSMRSLDALFLITVEELLNGDVSLANNVRLLERQLLAVKNLLEGKGTVDNLSCTECTGIKNENFSEDLDDCFEITEFHMEQKNGRKIILLHKLRCELREVIPGILEVCESSSRGNEMYNDMISKINQIINTLSQMICAVCGGEKCQRVN